MGKYARMREKYLRENKRTYHSNLMLEGTLVDHLLEVQESAEKMKEVMIPQYQENWKVTEELKAQDQLKWIQEMNNIKDSVEETIKKDLIYA
uniref:TnpV protein n=1 Tax=Gudongella sp. SC589 TaxID=3385990 RepID=UPI003904BCC4